MQHILDIIDEAPSDIYFKDSGKDVILRLVKDIQTVHNSVVIPNYYFNMGDGGAVVFIGNPEVERDEELIELANGLITLYLEARSGSVPDWVSHITEGQKNLGKAKEGMERRYVSPNKTRLQGLLEKSMASVSEGGFVDELLGSLNSKVDELKRLSQEAKVSMDALIAKHGFTLVDSDEDDLSGEMAWAFAALFGKKAPDTSKGDRYRTPSGFEFYMNPEESTVRLVSNRHMYRPMHRVLHYCSQTGLLYDQFFERLAAAKTISQANKVWALFSTIIYDDHIELDDEVELYVAKDSSLFYMLFEREEVVMIVDPFAKLVYVYVNNALTDAIKGTPSKSEERMDAMVALEGTEFNLNDRDDYNQLARVVFQATRKHSEASRILNIFAVMEDMF